MSYKDAGDNTVIAPFIGSTLHLYTTAPTDQTDGVEVTGGSYAAQATTLAQSGVDSNLAENSTAIIFTGMPACTVVAIGIKTTGGVLFYYAPLSTPKTFTAGDNATVAATALTVTVSA